ncbi:glycosyltransferase family 2 protein [Trichlorobacter ammonificans]|uniref:Glycosyl transferase family 2 n=1 Tax=Trichlorobacter ammonificans TaxID=2916410 RepID=A0ABN8HEU6_9BACT|nr:glycosyltransferase family 2 protein [Trichlorobacter ammonificans]CAH2031387.1 Glycosyl transferase family 2 [Trichlorobacter ammonificans]
MAYAIMLLTAALLFYLFIGYPLLLWLVARLFPLRHRCDHGVTPSVTLVISAYNEEKVIGRKLENALQLDYPPEQLTIMVVSDCSTDRTDELVRGFTDRGVILVRPEERRGKTAGLNLALQRIDSELVVFSDANALYDRQALRHLVKHFSDPAIGYVVGDARYREEKRTAAGVSEGSYWNIERMMKEWESAFSSVVGGDGALYAIRRKLYEPLRESDINDFVNPLQIVAKGYRGIFEPAAWCTEKPAGQFGKEFSRKVRIVNRSFNGLLRVPAVCNPLRFPRFAWQVISHKLLRWFSPYLLGINFMAALAVAADRGPDSAAALLVALYGGTALLALAGWRQDRRGDSSPLYVLPYYVALMNVASAVGVLLRLRGTVISTWNTVRAGGGSREPLAALLPCLLLATIIASIACLFPSLPVPAVLLHAVAYGLLGVIAYMYVGYPLVLTLLAWLLPARIDRDEQYCPEVTLLIVACDEERDIAAKLENSLLLDYPPERLKIVVASDGSGDATAALVREYAPRGVRLLDFPVNRGKIAALNDAMEQIQSEIVVLSDANVMYECRALRTLVRNFNDPTVGAVSGRVTLLNSTLSYRHSENAYYGIEHFIQEMEGATGTLVGADGAMYAIRRSLFLPPPNDTILDDFVIAMNIARQGYRVLHEPDALGFERNLHELADEFRRKARIISGGFQWLLRGSGLPDLSRPLLLFNFVSHKVLRWFSGALFIPLILLLLHIHLSPDLTTPLLSTVLYLFCCAALLALLGQVVPTVRRIIPINLLHYFFMLALASLVGLFRELGGGQQVTWRRGVTPCAE